MTPHSQDYEEIRCYLLGILSEEEQQRIEERLLEDADYFEGLLVCEEELIDDYVNDDLPADSRLKFEQHFLCTPERQQKLKFAFALGRYASQATEPVASKSLKDQAVVLPTNLKWGERFKAFWGGQSLALRYALVVAVIAFVAAFVWLSRPRTFAPKTFATVTLSISSGDRAEGSTATKVKFPQDVDALKIHLKLPEPSDPVRSYRVEWIDDQRVSKALPITEQDAQSLTVLIPARQVVRGQSALRLYATKSDGTEQRVNGNYFFTVE